MFPTTSFRLCWYVLFLMNLKLTTVSNQLIIFSVGLALDYIGKVCYSNLTFIYVNNEMSKFVIEFQLHFLLYLCNNISYFYLL